MTVHCARCGHTWDAPLKLPMPVKRALVAMRGFCAAGCPACGAHGQSVICGAGPQADPPQAQEDMCRSTP